MIISLYFQFTCNLQVDPGWCIHLQVTNDPLELNWSEEIRRNSHPPGYSSRESVGASSKSVVGIG